MALHLVQILNPTATEVIVAGHGGVHAKEIEAFHIDDTTADIWSYLDAGCVLLPDTADRQSIGYQLYNGQFAESNEG